MPPEPSDYVLPSASSGQAVGSPAAASIAALAEECCNLLNEPSNKLRDYDQDDGTRWAKLQDLKGRFNMWASNTNAFATHDVSLDYRLRDLPDARDLISGHLQTIRRWSSLCKTEASFAYAMCH